MVVPIQRDLRADGRIRRITTTPTVYLSGALMSSGLMNLVASQVRMLANIQANGQWKQMRTEDSLAIVPLDYDVFSQGNSLLCYSCCC